MNYASTLFTAAAPRESEKEDPQNHNRQQVRAGRSTRLGVPVNLIPIYTTENQEIGRPPMSLEEQNEVLAFYRNHKGYQFDWGQIIEEHAAEATLFHFLPTGLIDAGAQIKALNFVARDWYQALEPVFLGMVALVDGPNFVPITLRAENEISREWLAEVFLSSFWSSLMDTWSTKLGVVREGANDDNGCRQLPAREVEHLSVILIYRPSYKLNGELNTNAVHAIFVSVEESPRICFTSYNAQHGLVGTGWLPLPTATSEFETPPVDFIVDFHKESGAVTFDLRMPADLRTVPEIVQKLLLAVRRSPKEEDMRRALESMSARNH